MTGPMSNEKKKVLSQILVAVVIAILAGGTAPWWWNEIKNAFRTPSADDRNVQNVKSPQKSPHVKSSLTCREAGPLGDKWGVSYWDFDSDKCAPYQQPVAGADFIFKPVYPKGENTTFGVKPYHGARFAPLAQGRPPWGVPLSEFTQDMHVVPTRTKFPCLTNSGTLCQFEIIVRDEYVYVSVLLFEK